MTGRRRTGYALVCVAVLVLTGTTMLFGAEAKAPVFTLPNLEGEDVSLVELLEDGPVIVDFWSTSCKPCIKAFPDLQEIFDKYKDCGLTVLAVSVDGPRSVSKVGPLIASKGNTFEVLLDTSYSVARKYHVRAIPRTVLVRQDGTIAWAVTGYKPTNHEELDKAVAQLIPSDCPEEGSETPAAGAETTDQPDAIEEAPVE